MHIGNVLWDDAKSIPLKPIDPTAVEKMTYILNNIRSKKFKHRQDKWHCGTAHCFAGWNYMVEAQKLTSKNLGNNVTSIPKDTLVALLNWPNAENRILEESDHAAFTRGFTIKDWGLLETEADLLFNSESDLGQLTGQVRLFRIGYRYLYTMEAGNSHPTLEWIDISKDDWVSYPIAPTIHGYRYAHRVGDQKPE